MPEAGREAPRTGGHSIVYSLVPRTAPPSVLSLVRRRLAERGDVRVIVERRVRDRRTVSDRRLGGVLADGRPDRRQIRNSTGRRVAEHRAAVVPVPAPVALDAPGMWARRIRFVERQPASFQTVEDLDTARLVVRLQAGDPDAFDEIYERYVTRVYGYVRVALRDDHEAEDVTHEVFVGVLEALPRYRICGAPFRTWLFRIARNQVINHARKHGRIEVMDAEKIARRLDVEHSPMEFAGLEMTGDEELLRLIQGLPLGQRQVIVLRYAMDFDVHEIAEILGRSPNAVSQILQRAFANLRDRVVATGRHPDAAVTRLSMGRRSRPSRVALARRLALTY